MNETYRELLKKALQTFRDRAGGHFMWGGLSWVTFSSPDCLPSNEVVWILFMPPPEFGDNWPVAIATTEMNPKLVSNAVGWRIAEAVDPDLIPGVTTIEVGGRHYIVPLAAGDGEELAGLKWDGLSYRETFYVCGRERFADEYFGAPTAVSQYPADSATEAEHT